MLRDLQCQSWNGIIVVFDRECCFAYRSKCSLIVLLTSGAAGGAAQPGRGDSRRGARPGAAGGVRAGLTDMFIAGRRRPPTFCTHSIFLQLLSYRSLVAEKPRSVLF